ncbi:hypothetical protein [Paraburkholderia podalyriae]|uniref:Uncharacterized protein n=1 Tax=Paraburkholderia podalyriae TaxID=1938811 RepID=A0ABR7Q2A4_9BURK|nr:hypothetical protein [Paraburkholderia podalyriae]MBC8752686.1 hypothetical protein [Paraburkholderia podalyriae]
MHPLEQTIDGERERWATNLIVAIRSLRKHGFTVIQDPLAAEQSEDLDASRSMSRATLGPLSRAAKATAR